MQELVHPADCRELAEQETRRDYAATCAQALPPLETLERELRAMRAEIRAAEDIERRRPLTQAWFFHRAQEKKK